MPAAKKAVAKKTTAKKTAARKTTATHPAAAKGELAVTTYDVVKAKVQRGTTTKDKANQFLRDLDLPLLPVIQTAHFYSMGLSLPSGQTKTQREWADLVYDALTNAGITMPCSKRDFAGHITSMTES